MELWRSVYWTGLPHLIPTPPKFPQGHLCIKSLLGQGASGVVLEVFHPCEPEKLYALKLVVSGRLSHIELLRR
jgi:hypothetical protein